ncbi:MAG: nuclear transport factor 2 family protein [Pseudomonadota bacterium]
MEDRAEIQALQARYMFALDGRDADAYRATFASDGQLVSASGEESGNAIGAFLKEPPRTPMQPKAQGRHSITNVVLDIQGDTARGRSYWYQLGANNKAYTPYLGAYGHYEDELVKEGGQWRFKRRVIFNEMQDARAAKPERPTLSFPPPSAVGDSYADNREAIKDMQARYLYAMNWFDPAEYAGTFTPDGTVYMGARVETGSKQIETVITDYKEIIMGHPAGADKGVRPPAVRHAITNVVVEITGNTARSWAYWNTLQNDNLKRSAELGNYGSYEDELVKVDGRWQFKSRKIFNQMKADRVAPDELPMPVHLPVVVPTNPTYADNRAAIENLQARYMFALDWQDSEAYASTFTEDGQLVSAVATAKGRDAIRAEVVGMKQNDAKKVEGEKLRPFSRRHTITNLVLNIEGDRATGRAYWAGYSNDNAKRSPYLESYGYYEDELAKVNGEWLFTKRTINNEQRMARAAKPD